MLEGRKPGRALDVGMGEGRNTLYLARQGWDVTGFDPAGKAVALAESRANQQGLKIQTKVSLDKAAHHIRQPPRRLLDGAAVG